MALGRLLHVLRRKSAISHTLLTPSATLTHPSPFTGMFQFPKSHTVTGRNVARIGTSPKKSPRGTGATALRQAREEDQKRICQRFYAALVLSKLSQEVPLSEVAQQYGLPKGTLQGLQDAAGRFSVLVAAFCERLGWLDMQVGGTRSVSLNVHFLFCRLV